MDAAEKLRNRADLDEDLRLQRTCFVGRPQVVVLMHTERCNLRCVMCPRSLEQGVLQLGAAELRRITDQVFPAATIAIVPGQEGEPLLHEFDVIVDAARRHGVRLDVVTNGTLLTLERYRRWRDVLARVNVSIDTTDPDDYAAIRVGGDLRRLEDQLASIAAERAAHPDGCAFTVSAVVMRSNLASLPDLPVWAARFGCGAVMLQPLRQYSKSSPELDPLPETFAQRTEERGAASPSLPASGLSSELAEVFDEVARRARALSVNVYFGHFGLPPVQVREPPSELVEHLDARSMCWFLARGVVVGMNGVVTPCSHPTDRVFGNLLEQDLEEVWNGPAAQAMRREHFERSGNRFCSSCIHAPYLRATETAVG